VEQRAHPLPPEPVALLGAGEAVMQQVPLARSVQAPVVRLARAARAGPMASPVRVAQVVRRR
jgi:hypothetical protein